MHFPVGSYRQPALSHFDFYAQVCWAGSARVSFPLADPTVSTDVGRPLCHSARGPLITLTYFSFIPKTAINGVAQRTSMRRSGPVANGVSVVETDLAHAPDRHMIVEADRVSVYEYLQHAILTGMPKREWRNRVYLSRNCNRPPSEVNSPTRKTQDSATNRGTDK